VPGAWNPALNDLIPLLGGLYPNPDRARLVVRSAGLDPDEIDFGGPAKLVWLRIVEEANRHKRIEPLIRIVATDYPAVDFDGFLKQLAAPPPPNVPRLTDDAWKAARGSPISSGSWAPSPPSCRSISWRSACSARGRWPA
jgi:hypothetical protein